MFDFEKFEVYEKSQQFVLKIHNFLKESSPNKTINNQFFRASLSIPLNIAEGAGRFSRPDKKNFYVIARGSVFECVSLLKIMKEINAISNEDYSELYSILEQISKMLSGLINSMK